MSKINLIALVIISAMPTGYRRAGFALEQGENHLTDINEEQYHLLNDDPNLAVSVNEQADAIDSVKLPSTKVGVKVTAKKSPVKKVDAK